MQRKVLVLLLVAVVLALAGSAAAGVATTKHDMSATGGSSAFGDGAQTQICIYCHTPHNANGIAPQLIPLWNRKTTATAAFTVYSSSTLNATLGQPAGASKACLSCHDGTIGVDAYGTPFTAAGTKPITSASTAYLGTDLSNDHPVSFLYNAALATADGGLVTPASTSLVVTGIPLYAGNLECASCHSVHDNTNAPFLRVSNAGSALCLKCHNK